MFQTCSTPPRNISTCVAHHLEIFQTRSTPPRNITRSDKTACTEGPWPCDFGGGFESTRAYSLCRYKGPRALNLPGSVSLPRHFSWVYEFSTGWPSNRERPCHQHWLHPWLSQGPLQALQAWPRSSHALCVILLLSYTQAVNAVQWFQACW